MTEVSKDIKRPILRYHGGKWMLAPWIISNFPEHKIYCEPFGGGASVLLRKERVRSEIYNDIDDEVFNLFTVARNTGDTLVERLRKTPFSRSEFNLSYQDCEEPIERARRTIIRSFMGFGSGLQSHQRTGFRSNSNRSGSTPAHDWVNYPDAFLKIIDRLKGVVIENKDGIEVMKQHDTKETLHYVDPPYLLDTRYKGQKTKVYRHELTDEYHESLCEFVKSMEGIVVISGYDNEMYNDVLTGWHKEIKSTYADGAKKRVEILWINKPIQSVQTTMKFLK